MIEKLVRSIREKNAPIVVGLDPNLSFVPGFINYLITEEHTDPALAEKTAKDVWTVILNSASYLFNASHAYAMNLDCLYGLYLKLHYPYEFYLTLLKLYTEKGNKEKISLIISEMKRYKGIHVIPGRFGEDNTDWTADKNNHTISLNLASIKFISSNVPKEMLKLASGTYSYFVDLLRDIQMKTKVNTRQLEILIKLNYFSPFGKTGKLKTLYDAFFDGENKIAKSYCEKTVIKRMDALRQLEEKLPDEELPMADRLQTELDTMERCISCDPSINRDTYFITEIDDAYGVKIRLYSMQRGTMGTMKMTKKNYAYYSLKPGMVVRLDDWVKRPKYEFKGGKRAIVKDQYEYWLESVSILASKTEEKEK